MKETFIHSGVKSSLGIRVDRCHRGAVHKPNKACAWNQPRATLNQFRRGPACYAYAEVSTSTTIVPAAAGLVSMTTWQLHTTLCRPRHTGARHGAAIKVNHSCCTLRPRTTSFPDENTYQGQHVDIGFTVGWCKSCGPAGGAGALSPFAQATWELCRAEAASPHSTHAVML